MTCALNTPSLQVYQVCRLQPHEDEEIFHKAPTKDANSKNGGYCDERCPVSSFEEFKISTMSPNRIFMFLINPPSGNVRIQKLKEGEE